MSENVPSFVGRNMWDAVNAAKRLAALTGKVRVVWYSPENGEYHLTRDILNERLHTVSDDIWKSVAIVDPSGAVWQRSATFSDGPR